MELKNVLSEDSLPVQRMNAILATVTVSMLMKKACPLARLPLLE
jgi:hypothetical protein